MSLARGPLFEPDVPNGLQYRRDFVVRDEEAALADAIAGVEFSTFEMRGVAARRRVAFFGRSYDKDAPAPPLPPFLLLCASESPNGQASMRTPSRWR
jgi:hypothetical protein